MSHSLHHSFLAAFGAVATAALFVGASVLPAFTHATGLVL